MSPNETTMEDSLFFFEHFNLAYFNYQKELTATFPRKTMPLENLGDATMIRLNMGREKDSFIITLLPATRELIKIKIRHTGNSLFANIQKDLKDYILDKYIPVIGKNINQIYQEIKVKILDTVNQYDNSALS